MLVSGPCIWMPTKRIGTISGVCTVRSRASWHAAAFLFLWISLCMMTSKVSTIKWSAGLFDFELPVGAWEVKWFNRWRVGGINKVKIVLFTWQSPGACTWQRAFFYFPPKSRLSYIGNRLVLLISLIGLFAGGIHRRAINRFETLQVYLPTIDGNWMIMTNGDSVKSNALMELNWNTYLHEQRWQC